MVAIGDKDWAATEDVTSELEELRAEALRLILVVVAALAVYVHFAVSAIVNSVEPMGFAFMLGILIAAGLAYWSLRFGVRLSSVVLTLLSTGLLAIALIGARQAEIAYWFSPVVIVAGVLLGWRYSIAVAGLASGIIVDSAFLISEPLTTLVTGPLLLTLVSLLLAWLLSHPTHTALDWAWHSYVRATRIAEELRDHQEQLERTIKSLNVAYKHLEQLNLELARARHAAEQARRLKAEFAAAISHELRTPLNLIIGFSEMMALTPQAYGGQTLPDTYQSDVDAIYRNACHLSSLVDDVLDLSQIEADRMGLQKELVRLAPVVDEAVTTIARLFRAKGLALTVEVPLDLPAVFADRTRVRQILINLLNNAVRFTVQGSVTVRARSSGSDVIVSVTDTGAGIATENLRVVFEEFRQIYVLGETRTIGSGLGLAVSKRFAELHGGSMWVESQLGVGSTFSFSLPSCESVVTSGYSQSERWVSHRNESTEGQGTILVIDHDGDAARLFGRHLDGYRVLPASSVEAARRLAAQNAVRAVIVVEPNRPDWAMVRRLEDIFPEIPVVACSLNTRKVTPRNLGVADYLAKPVGRDQIRKALGRLGRRVRNVLIVDDDEEMVRLLGRLVSLASRRYVVWEARSAREALSIMETRKPDAVLLDLVMPDMSGDELLKRMHCIASLESIPVILVTGHGITDETMTAEFFGIAQKGGFSVRELMRSLRLSLEAVHRPQTTELQNVEQLSPADRLG